VDPDFAAEHSRWGFGRANHAPFSSRLERVPRRLPAHRAKLALCERNRELQLVCKPRASSARTASFTRWSSGERARCCARSFPASGGADLVFQLDDDAFGSLLPTPEIWERAFTSPFATAPRNAVTLMPPENVSRRFWGRWPLTVFDQQAKHFALRRAHEAVKSMRIFTHRHDE